MKNILHILILVSISNYAFCQTPTIVKVNPNSTVSLNGNLDKGFLMKNLSWAWNSSVACFPKTQRKGFNGNHVLYETILPKKSIITITLTPKNSSVKMSLYGYQVGESSNSVVPNLSSCISCEVDNNQNNKATSNKRTITLNATTNAYKVYFGVVGEKRLKTGDYEITVTLKGGVVKMDEQKAVVVNPFPNLESNKSISVTGNLANGVIMQDLSWAWNSSVACFPETQKEGFNGKHVLYQTTIPKRAIIEITLIPKNPNAIMSLYGYQVGESSTAIVPNLSSCVSCEADNNQSKTATNNTRIIKLNAITNSYKVFFGVVGEKGLSEGDYTVSVKLIGGESSTKEQESVLVKNAPAPIKGRYLAYKDDIKNGVFIHDLSWAWNSSVACFPETQKESFNGKHVVFQTELPKYSKMTITLKPTNPDSKLSLYGYQVGTTSTSVVPSLSSCISCEVDNNQAKKATDNTRTISFMAINHPYKIMIGVVGEKGLTEGEFIIQIEVGER